MNSRKQPFPFHILRPFSGQSYIHRAADLSRYLTRMSSFPSQIVPEFDHEYVYLTLTCKADIDLTKASLRSLLHAARRPPRIIVAFDASLQHADIHQELGTWPGPLDTFSILETASEMQRRGWLTFAEFCTNHIFGYKMAAILRASGEGRVLYADADILWHSDPADFLRNHSTLPLYCSEDRWPSLDDSLAPYVDTSIWARLKSGKTSCAGFLLLNSAEDIVSFLQPALRQFLREHSPQRFTEQTLFSAATEELGRRISPEVIEMIEPGSATWTYNASRSLVARHYPTVDRPQFWMDAFRLVRRYHAES